MISAFKPNGTGTPSLALPKKHRRRMVPARGHHAKEIKNTFIFNMLNPNKKINQLPATRQEQECERKLHTMQRT